MRISSRFPVLLLTALVAGCGSSDSPTDPEPDPDPILPIEAGLTTRGLTVEQFPRAYRVYLPANLDPTVAVDVVVVLHGLPRIDMAPVTDMNGEANARGFAVVYAESAFGQDWVHGCNCTPNGLLRIDDEGYFDAVLADLDAGLPGGLGRAFVSGFSNGGMMTYTLACEMADRFDGFAAVSAGMWTWTMENRCRSSTPAPILMFNGTADGQFPMAGLKLLVSNGAELEQESIDEMVAWWAARNRCSVVPEVTELPDDSPDGTTAQRWAFTACDTPTVWYRIEGGGHTWPGSPVVFSPALGPHSLDVDATRIMLDAWLGAGTS